MDNWFTYKRWELNKTINININDDLQTLVLLYITISFAPTFPITTESISDKDFSWNYVEN